MTTESSLRENLYFKAAQSNYCSTAHHVVHKSNKGVVKSLQIPVTHRE